MIRKVFFLTLTTICSALHSHSQGLASFEGTKSTSSMFLRNIIPPSPTAASLGKYGDQQINLFTGLPSVNIPIYEMKTSGISVPISLSYSSSGLKVTEAASWVGLGWTLNGMGVITRVVRGAPDFTGSKNFFDIRAFPLPFTYSQKSYDSWCYLISALTNDALDPEPDIYIVNAPDLSIKFYYDLYKRIQTIPYNNGIRINYNTSTAQYEITTDNGNIYYFGGTQAIETTTQGGVPLYTSTWHLKKITSQVGGQITFNYTVGTSTISQDQFSETEEVKSAEYGNIGDCAIPTAQGRTTQFSTQSITPCFLNSIDDVNETIYFNTTSRSDIPGDNALSEIKVYSKSSSKYVFNYSFDYSYFPQVSTYCWGYSNGNNSHPHDAQAICKRLRLDKFTEKGSEVNTSGLKVYQFQYSTKAIPSRCSLSQDHWGYYNGASNNSLLPHTADVNYPYSQYSANRDANENYGDAGMLQKIIYPTGGETDFTYESNKIQTSVMGQGSSSVSASLSGISPLFEASTTFSLTTPQRVLLVFNLADADLLDQGLQRKVQILDQSGAVVFSVFNYNTDVNGIWVPNLFGPVLSAGTYTLKVSRNYSYSSYPNITAKAISATATFNPQAISSITTKIIGGFRVKRIVDKTDAIGAEINVKEFVYDNPYLIANIGDEDYKATYIRWFHAENPAREYSCTFMSRNSSSVQPLGTIQGGNIAYGKVTTLHGTNGTNGKTEQYFSVDQDMGGYSLAPIYQPVTSYDHRRGNLLQQIDYNNLGEIVKITTNNYENILKYDGHFYRPYLTVDKYCNSDPCVYAGSCKDASFRDFSLPSEWIRLKNSSETVFSGSSFVTTTKEFSYSNPNHMLATQVKAINSKGESREVKQTYPLDYKPSTTDCIEQIERNFETNYTNLYNTFVSCANNATSMTILNACYTTYQSGYDNLINGRTTSLRDYASTFNTLASNTTDPILKVKYQMIASNILSETLEQTETKNGTTQLTKTVNDFDNFSGIILPKAISTSTLSNSLHTDVTFNAYDTRGNPKQITPRTEPATSFIWNYNQTYPVAKISNCAYNTAAYTSFEADEKGGWNYGYVSTNAFCPTGQKCFTLQNNGTITLSQSVILNTANSYIVSYWTTNSKPLSVTGTTGSVTQGKTIKDWTYFEHKISNVATTTISGTGFIDELRLYPETAQMITYTYDPLVGMTSQCDINNKISYYEYDKFGRLRLIRDQDYNLLKKICYNYTGQADDCAYFFNRPKSKLFIKNNSGCSANTSGSEEVYTVPASVYWSNISQDDADQKATADINANGQAYANDKGSCLPNVNIFSANFDQAPNYNVKFKRVVYPYDEFYFPLSYIATPNPPGIIQLTNQSTAIPQGTYNVTVSFSGTGSAQRTITIGPNNYLTKVTSNPTVYFNNVIVTPNSFNTVAIGHP